MFSYLQVLFQCEIRKGNDRSGRMSYQRIIYSKCQIEIEAMER